MTQTIGILSDTHLYSCEESFRLLADSVFWSCSSIIHAGDITTISVLNAFSGKNVIAVHGNMCSPETTRQLPEARLEIIAGYKIAVCHGAGNRYSIEERLLNRFHDADCIVYGHTHQTANHYVGKTLLLNPGSFIGTGSYGSPGTYAILKINEDGLNATLYEHGRPL